MQANVIWASEAPKNNVAAPSTDKQKQGWIKEVPPHEWFNWYMNRTDSRLTQLEEPWTAHIFTSAAGSREEAIPANEKFQLPAKYIVGAGQLRVFLDGILCEAGEREQYVEAGQAGDLSDYIRFNDTIDPSHDIRIEIPVSGLQNAGILDGTIVTVKDLMRLIVQSAMLDYGLGVITERADSLPGTRLKEYADGDTYTVPQYLVGGNGLQVFVDGLLCVRRLRRGLRQRRRQGHDHHLAPGRARHVHRLRHLPGRPRHCYPIGLSYGHLVDIRYEKRRANRLACPSLRKKCQRRAGVRSAFGALPGNYRRAPANSGRTGANHALP